MLEVCDIESFYGPVQALFGVSLTIAEGEAVALMGRNGMGKTTTIRAICGMTPALRGTIRFVGHDIRRARPYRIARLGVGLAPEGRRCFPNLTVRENLIATSRPGPWTVERVTALFPQLDERAGQMAAALSGGEQQMLAIGRALLTNPRLLILDEATEGLAPLVRREIWGVIARLKAAGVALLVVDKSLAEMRHVVDRCVILDHGASVWTGTPPLLTPAVRDRYLGV